ncbi:MAG: hypothetical protein RL757_2927 [Bacteroidota bacterium]|jgi:putative Mn2+ efflux pump MntP
MQQKKNNTDVLKYADIGFRMLVLIAIGTWLGMRLDAWLGNQTQYCAALGALLAIGGAIYWLLKDLFTPKT